MRPPTRLVEDSGAGVVLALALITAIVTLATVLFSVSNRQIHQERLSALADSASLAGADALRGLSAGAPCDVARQLVLSGNARILSCSIIETDLLIEVESEGTVAVARAGEPETPQN